VPTKKAGRKFSLTFGRGLREGTSGPPVFIKRAGGVDPVE
jgi:hypothetical protein